MSAAFSTQLLYPVQGANHSAYAVAAAGDTQARAKPKEESWLTRKMEECTYPPTTVFVLDLDNQFWKSRATKARPKGLPQEHSPRLRQTYLLMKKTFEDFR